MAQVYIGFERSRLTTLKPGTLEREGGKYRVDGDGEAALPFSRHSYTQRKA